MSNDKEIQATNIQLVAIIATIISAIISIITTYNQKLDLEDKDTPLTPKELYKLTLFNRLLIIGISIVFLYVNYTLYKISKEKGEDLKTYTLQIIASVITLIPGLIALYVVISSNTENIVDIENPII